MRWARAAVLLVLAAMPLAACTGVAADEQVCVPELAVSPAEPRPGRIVTVSTARACPGGIPAGERWVVRIQPDGRRIPLAQATVVPAADGSFEVSITVPPTMPQGRAIVWITNYWEYAACPAAQDCAAASGLFEVGPRRE